MRGAQQMIDVGERGLRQRAERLARHHQHLLAHDASRRARRRRDLAVGRRVLAERKQRRVLIGGRRVGGEGGVHGIQCAGFHLQIARSEAIFQALSAPRCYRRAQSACIEPPGSIVRIITMQYCCDRNMGHECVTGCDRGQCSWLKRGLISQATSIMGATDGKPAMVYRPGRQAGRAVSG